MKKLFCLLSFVLCLGCGFSPMYSDNVSSQTADVWVAPIYGTNGIDLRNNLNARFGGGNDQESARYILSVDLRNPDSTFRGLQRTGDATWQEIRMTAKYEVKERDSGKVLVSGTEVAVESYTFVRDLVAAKASQDNAVQNTIRLLADKISMRTAAAISE
ncbi:MAG: LPS assembly lipoprotein LptE [Alphaproteobacteria bacterium]|nr:LPS assembly lipoprotein LptE [Alphaproteobacteria bacterium]